MGLAVALLGANAMAAPHLTTVSGGAAESVNTTSEVYELGREVETSAQRIGRLQREARTLAHEQVEGFAHDLDVMALRAAEISEGGEAYPAGARELASRIADDLTQKALLLTTLMNRTA